MRAGLAFKGLGQQVHKSRGQQRASGQAEHVLGVACQYAKAKYSGQPDAANAGSQGSHHNCYQSHSCIHPYSLGTSPK